MNLSAIKRNCMGRRRAVIYNSINGGQWITNGVAAWLVEGIKVDEEAIVSLFNLSVKQQTDMLISEKTVSDRRFTYLPIDGEEKAEELGAMVWKDGETYLALFSSRGTMWIPYGTVKHIKADNRRCFIRWDGDRPMVAVYGDVFCCVLVLPLMNFYASEMCKMANMMAAPPFNWPDDDAEAADAEAEAEKIAGEMDV